MFKGHKSTVNSLAFSPNGRSLISGSDDRSVRIWNIRDGSSKVLPLIVTSSFFISVAFSPYGRYVAAGNLDNFLWIWDSRAHRLVAKWEGHADSLWCTEFTPDGKGLISGSSDQTAKYWDVTLLGIQQGASTGTVVNEEQGFPEVRSFLGHDVRILLLSRDVDGETFLPQERVCSAAFFPENTRWIMTGSYDHSVRVWDTQNGICHLMVKGHTDWIRGVDVSQTQDFLATASKDGHVAVWKYKLL